MSERKWWQRSVAVACATGMAVGLAVIGAGTASASPADENLPSYQEPDYQVTGAATQVYSLAWSSDQIGTSAVVTVNNGSMNNGAIVDLWQRTNSFSNHGGVLQTNQLWEFVPKAGNTGGGLETGWGWLRSRASGKCLQVMSASTAEGAEVNQWDCIEGADNELWRATPGPMGTWDGRQLQVKHSGAYLGLNGPTCGTGGTTNLNGNGDRLYARYSSSQCTRMVVKKETYSYATNQISFIPNWSFASLYQEANDYRCLPEYHFRLINQDTSGAAITVEFEQLGGVVSGDPPLAQNDWLGVPGPFLNWRGYERQFGQPIDHKVTEPGWVNSASLWMPYRPNTSGRTQVAQTMLFCSPGQAVDADVVGLPVGAWRLTETSGGA